MKIRLVSTGGTILSSPGEHGFSPSGDAGGILGFLESRFPSCEFSLDNLMSLDSSNIEPEDWCVIARAVYGSLGSSCGVIILHGTDTMAYTAAALSFMLRGLSLPVTLTGSQIPYENPYSDALSNLVTAVAAVENGITGVTVSFRGKVIDGVRATKASAASMDAFESVGAPPAAVMTASGLEAARPRTAAGAVPGTLDCRICPDVVLLKVTPGTKPEIFDALRGIGYRGVVMEAFGVGGVHWARRNLAEAVSRAVSSGMPVVLRSQCRDGAVDLDAYEVGSRLRDAGVIPARMTAEACVAKLMWALGHTSDVLEIKKIFGTDIAGELYLYLYL